MLAYFMTILSIESSTLSTLSPVAFVGETPMLV
jgi:hypothetical protein